MSLGLRESKNRRRRQFRTTLFKWTVALCLIVAAGTYAYLSGKELSQGEVNTLKGKIASLEADAANLEQKNTELQTEISGERARAEEWRQRYTREVPSGDLKDLFDLTQQKIESGVSVDRLRFVVGAAENRENCDGKPVTKRFIVQTPLHSGANGFVAFADGTITLTAVGVPARDSLGNPEAWFDPAEPVNIRIVHIGGKSENVSGKLPLNPSIVFGNNEYRFSVVKGSRGFVQVTGTRCDYP